MKYLFFVQSEGRGHMSQALALKEKLEASGHQVIAVTISLKSNEEVPVFFKDSIGCPIVKIASPKFLKSKDGKGIRLIASIFSTIFNTPRYLKSFVLIRKTIKKLNPDVLVNFYEPTAGNYYRLYRDKRPMFCIGHQYLIAHHSFKSLPINFIDKFYYKFYNYFASGKRTTKIALSFTNESDQTDKNLFICPPLIRKEIKNVPVSHENFTLCYILNAGYSDEIISWQQANPNFKIEAFWNKPGEEETRINNNLVFHKLSGQKFINLLAACNAYVGTAGFDSVAEAAYLQKRILVIPTKNHFEQKCNAFDAERAKIAISSESFNFSLLSNQTKTHPEVYLKNFKEWVDNFDDKIVKLLTEK